MENNNQPKKAYNFIVDATYVITKEHYYSIKASSREEATEIFRKAVKENNLQMLSDYRYDTEEVSRELMKPQMNNNNATLLLRFPGNDIIISTNKIEPNEQHMDNSRHTLSS